MQAPDKIYLHRTTGNPRLNGKVHSYKPAKIRDDDKIIEYIRKDALLEWANGQKKATEGLIKEHPKDDSLWAEMHWYEQLIKHIESL